MADAAGVMVEDDAPRCRALWLAVLRQAAADAAGADARASAEVRVWINTAAFEEVADLADVCPELARARIEAAAQAKARRKTGPLPGRRRRQAATRAKVVA